MIVKRCVAFLLTAALLAACAGRAANPVQSVQPGDAALSCLALQEEYEFNTAAAKEKIALNKSKDGFDMALGVFGALFFWPILFSIDTQNAEGNEGNALIDRNRRLLFRAKGKGCNTADWTPLPEKYS